MTTTNPINPAPASHIAPNIPPNIVFEDEHLLVVDKPAGLVVHPGRGNKAGTLVNWLLKTYGRKGLANMNTENDPDRPGIVHRLDKNTSGLMLVAKTDEAGYLLQEMIRERQVERKYTALVHGVVKPNTGLIDVSIARSLRRPTLFEATARAGARAAQTELLVKERYHSTTLIELKLQTGRTHQIRVHCKFIGHPVVGDPDYQLSQKCTKNYGLARQFLHATSLIFTHPITGQKIETASDLPDDLQEALHTCIAK